MVKSSRVNKEEVFEFAGSIFLLKIEGDLEKAYHSLNRLGITLPVEKAKVKRKRNQRVNITIYFHGQEKVEEKEQPKEKESQENLMFREWILDTIMPKVQKIQSAQKIKEKSKNFKNQEPDTTIEITALRNRDNVKIATYKVKI